MRSFLHGRGKGQINWNRSILDAPHCDHLDERVREIEEGKYKELIEELMNKPLDEIKELYNTREIEK